MSKRIVIVGGGSSGWMTAAYLAKALGETAHVTVVESPNVRTIGVGEATFSYMKLFFDFLGLRERDWMPRCSAAYKLAIRFENWTKAGGHFYHPFQRYESAAGADAAEWWLKLLKGQRAFDEACFTVTALCEAMRSPRHLDGTVFDEAVRDYFVDSREAPNAVMSGHVVQYPYGYHFNAADVAEVLGEWAMARGVRHVVDDVVAVRQREDGSIAAVRTKGHGDVEGDLFVDCTGFHALLIEKTLGEPFQSFNDVLLTDSAIAFQVPRDIERDGIPPYTTAHANGAGWSWTIPLYGRDGVGYVYSSKFMDRDDAEKDFRDLLGPSAEGCVANHIRMRIGRRRRSWVKNCVAIGLASGFVEPLESTGIFFIQHGIEELVNHFPSAAGIDENMVRGYNKSVGECIDGVRDFLTIHYYASDRDDTPFWRATKQVTLPESLQERLDIWKGRLPTMRNVLPSFHGFEAYSWSVMLLGLGYHPAGPLPRLDHLDASAARAMFAAIQRRGADLVRTLPSQYEYLTRMRNRSGSGTPRMRDAAATPALESA